MVPLSSLSPPVTTALRKSSEHVDRRPFSNTSVSLFYLLSSSTSHVYVAADDPGSTKLVAVLLTPCCCSPVNLIISLSASDIWSLGVILFMLVCGQPPFQEANDSETLTMIMDCKYTVPARVSGSCKE